METMPVSKFKATCLAVLQRVKRTGRPVLVTRFGKPIAEIVPPTPATRRKGWLGCAKGSVRIVGDIVAPALEPEEWEALRD